MHVHKRTIVYKSARTRTHARALLLYLPRAAGKHARATHTHSFAHIFRDQRKS